MTFRTIDTDMNSLGVSTGATIETEITTGVSRRSRAARRAAIRSPRHSARVRIYSTI